MKVIQQQKQSIGNTKKVSDNTSEENQTNSSSNVVNIYDSYDNSTSDFELNVVTPEDNSKKQDKEQGEKEARKACSE